MKIIRRKSDNIVTHAGEDLQLQDSGLMANGSWNPTLNTSTCDQLEVDSLPPYFQGNAWTYTEAEGWQLVKAEILEQAKSDKYTEIEAEHARRTELMPYTTPDGANIEVKLTEDSPHKPRMSWLSGTSSWGLAEIQEGNPDATDSLIAADDTLHTLTASEWVQFGKAMKQWIRDNLMAAKTHMANVQALTDVQNIIDYDYSGGWPT